MRVLKVYFNHDPALTAKSAINIKHNGRASLGDPEWANGLTIKPAVYVKDALTPPVVIKVVFADGPPNSTVRIRAVTGVSPRQPRPVGPTPRPGSDNPLGAVREQIVQFDSTGHSAPMFFETEGQPNKTDVGIYTFIWTWQFQTASHWVHFSTTMHRACMIPALPKPPWTIDPMDPDGWELPWSEAIEKACLWAAGTGTPDESLEAIASAINHVPHQIYNRMGHLVTEDLTQFMLAQYLSDLDGGVDFCMNCRDIASAVITFANLLGSNLWPVNISTAFDTNSVRTLVDANFRTIHFTFHEVAAPQQSLPMGFVVDLNLLSGGADELIRVYDSCLHLQGDVFPANMDFGGVLSGAGYRAQLINPMTGNGLPSRVRQRRHVI